MKRIVLILGIIAAVLLISYFVIRSFTKSNSPQAVAQIEQNGLSIKVDYCQPYKKGRTIFGGLVPYEKVWRTGANEATVIDIGQDVTITDKPLKAGKYSLWTIPFKNGWMTIFNRETGQWGTNYNPVEDELRVLVNSRPHRPMAEQFTIRFEPQPAGADMLLTWDETEAVVPFRKK